MKASTIVVALLCGSMVAGCGTKGPLYLPKKGSATQTQPAPLPDPTNPVIPAPETTSEKPGT